MTTVQYARYAAVVELKFSTGARTDQEDVTPQSDARTAAAVSPRRLTNMFEEAQVQKYSNCCMMSRALVELLLCSLLLPGAATLRCAHACGAIYGAGEAAEC